MIKREPSVLRGANEIWEIRLVRSIIMRLIGFFRYGYMQLLLLLSHGTRLLLFMSRSTPAIIRLVAGLVEVESPTSSFLPQYNTNCMLRSVLKNDKNGRPAMIPSTDMTVFACTVSRLCGQLR